MRTRPKRPTGSKTARKAGPATRATSSATALGVTAQPIETELPPREGQAATLARVAIEAIPPAVVETAPARADSPVPRDELAVPVQPDGPPPFTTPRLSGFYAEVAPERGELRLDVDGVHPLMKASGVVSSGLADRLHWVANLSPAADAVDRWTGEIWYKNGSMELIPQGAVEITVQQGDGQREAVVRFAGGAATRTRVFRRKSAFFHPVEFEFDTVMATSGVTSIDTGAHPNRPADLARETLTVETVFRRAGFDR